MKRLTYEQFLESMKRRKRERWLRLLAAEALDR